MSDMTEEQAAFEAWARTDDGNCNDHDLLKFDDSDVYRSDLVDRDWTVWQAARAIPLAAAEPEPLVWESTTPVYIAFVSQRRYEGFSAAVQKWYRPICQNCAAPDRAPSTDSATERDAARLDYITRKHVMGSSYGGITSLNIIVHRDDYATGGALYAIDCMIDRDAGRAIAAMKGET